MEANSAKPVTDFYIAIGQPRISRQKREEGVAILRDLEGQGFCPEEIGWGMDWIVSHRAQLGEVYSLRLLPQVMGQALQDRTQAQQAAEKQRQQREADRQEKAAQQRQEALARRYDALCAEEQEVLRQQATQALLASGIKPALLVGGLVKAEAYCLLEQAEAAQGMSTGAG